jgi:hypothetical protein
LIATPSLAYVDDFQLVDQNRDAHHLYYHADAPAIVIMTTGNGCPIARLAGPMLQEIRDQYADQGVEFFLLNANTQDTRDAVRQEAELFGIDLPILMDETQLIAESLGVERTGEVFVIEPSKGWEVVYHGPIDDRLTYERQREVANETWLIDALDSVLAGEEVEVAEVQDSPGCLINFLNDDPEVHAQISYSHDVAPVLSENCATCHAPGGIGPFAMDSYETVRGYAPMIREVIRTDRMPPYFPDAHEGVAIQNDNELTTAEIQTIVHWIEAGAERGEGPDYLAEHFAPVEEWPLGTPDYIVEIPAFTIPASGIIEYQNPVVANTLEEGVWLRATHVRPGSLQGVHHVTSGYIPPRGDAAAELDPIEQNLPSGSVGSYTPGQNPQPFADQVGTYLAPGGSFRFSMHYTTFGREEVDHTQVGLYFHDEPPMYIKRSSVIGDSTFAIPPGDAEYVETSYMVFPADAEIYTLYPHAHYRGKHVELTIRYPDGSEEVLLSLPKYDFNWQRDYDPVEPIQVPAGSRLIVEWTYDNSEGNWANPNAQATVLPGDQTFEEMMYFRINYRWLEETRDNITNYTQIMQSDRGFASLDDNVNDLLEPQEIVGVNNMWLAADFASFDANDDGGLNRDEYAAAQELRPASSRGFSRRRPEGLDEFGDVEVDNGRPTASASDTSAGDE